MSAPLQFDGLDRAQLGTRPLHLAIGIFDGVHLGHRAVVESAVQSARLSHGIAAVLTFSPHPSVLFRPQQPTRLILDLASKVRLLGELGVEAVIVQEFDAAFAAIEAEDLIPRLRRSLPHLAALYVGENWRFGRGRRGDIAMLVAEGRKQGLAVFSAPRVNLDGEPISSTRIRSLLEMGNVAAVATLLGYPYTSTGKVVSGKRLGRTLGFPTLNLAWSPDLRPRFGVYAMQVRGERTPDALPAVANYGLRPTVERMAEPRLEVHVLGPCPYDEGDVIAVEWLRFIRPEMKFDGLPALQAQIDRDAATARTYFSLP